MSEGRDEPGQGLERVRSPKGGGQVLADLAAGREVVEEGFEESGPGAELIIDGHADDIGLASDGLDAETGQAAAGAGRKQLTGRGEDAGAGLVGGHLALAETVWTRPHSA